MNFPSSLQKTLTWSLIGTTLCFSAIIATFWVSQDLLKFDTESNQIQADYITGQKALIKTEVDRVVDYIEYQRQQTEQSLRQNIRLRVTEAVDVAQHLYDQYQDQLPADQLQALIRETLRASHFNGGRGYYFIYDLDGNNILLPYSPELEGTNLLHLQDSRGLYTVQRCIDLVKKDGEGFLRWYWYKPGQTTHMSEKIGYSKLFAPFSWYIGSGEYVEDVEKDIQQATLARINSMQYGIDGYFFVFDSQGTPLAHHRPELLGNNQWHLVDDNGLAVTQELIQLGQRKEGGYLSYIDPMRPSTGAPAHKISYVRAIASWDWVVGTGCYVDEVTKIIDQQKQALTDNLRHNLLITALLSLPALAIIWLLARSIAARISRNLDVFNTFFAQAAAGSSSIDDQMVHFSEFKQLADAANTMVQQRNQMAASLAEAQQQLERSRKMESLGILAGEVAHDLNNVLAAMVGFPDLLLMTMAKDAPERSYVEAIRDSGLRASDIVQDLLAMARRGVLQMTVLDLNRLLTNYLGSPEHIKLLTNNPDVRVAVDLAPDLLHVRASQVHIQKTIMNLIANAAEAQPDGGTIFISTENRCLEVQTDQGFPPSDKEYCVLSVRDQGIGIGEEDLAHIFEPFFTKKQLGRSGTGLGMSVVWGTVQDHDGFIEVTTSEGKGARFDLYFPATREAPDQEQVEAEITSYQGAGQSILLVDDLPEQRKLAGSILKSLGYTVRTAASGEEAVETLQQQAVDLLILDMLMPPGMDGLDTYRQVLTISPHQPTIIVSGFAETERVKTALDLGVACYIKKPYTLRVLAQAVLEALARNP